MPFAELDHKTQFYVLFQEFTRRELEANTVRNGGDLPTAQALFAECLARAQQLDVAELRARSHEGLASVHEMAGDRNAARDELRGATADRAGGVTGPCRSLRYSARWRCSTSRTATTSTRSAT